MATGDNSLGFCWTRLWETVERGPYLEMPDDMTSEFLVGNRTGVGVLVEQIHFTHCTRTGGGGGGGDLGEFISLSASATHL